LEITLFPSYLTDMLTIKPFCELGHSLYRKCTTHVHVVTSPRVRTTDDGSCTQLHISRNRNVCHARPVMRHTVDTRNHHAAVFIGAHTASRNRVYGWRNMTRKCVNYSAACCTCIYFKGSINYSRLFFFRYISCKFLLHSTNDLR